MLGALWAINSTFSLNPQEMARCMRVSSGGSTAKLEKCTPGRKAWAPRFALPLPPQSPPCGLEGRQRQPACVPVWELRVCGWWQVHGWWNAPRNELEALQGELSSTEHQAE